MSNRSEVLSTYQKIFWESPHDSSSTAQSEMKMSSSHVSWSVSPGLDSTRLKEIRTDEKKQMQSLNDRFAVLIDELHTFEKHNKVLEMELIALRCQQPDEASDKAEFYQKEIKDLKSQLEKKSELISKIETLRWNYKEEYHLWVEAEEKIRNLKKDVFEARLESLSWKNEVNTLEAKISFLSNEHAKEVTELMNTIKVFQKSVKINLCKQDLASALKDIRGQYETMASLNLKRLEDCYKTELDDLTEQLNKSNVAIHSSSEEVMEFRKEVHSKTIEVESLRGIKEALERQLYEMEERHRVDIQTYQESIAKLEVEQRDTKHVMSRYQIDYQELLNVKKALDFEILTYRNLLEGGEAKIDKIRYSFSVSTSEEHCQDDFSTSTEKDETQQEECEVTLGQMVTITKVTEEGDNISY